MAQTTLAGPDASVDFFGSAYGCKFNAFTINLTQSTMEAVGFGETEAEVRGGVVRGSGTVSGITTKGSATDDLGANVSPVAVGTFAPGQTALMKQAPATITLTFASGCTLAMSAVVTGIASNVSLESFDQTTYSFVKSGVAVETWTVS